ncbi:hypothetical protein ABER68_07940 [Paenibacillus alvei]
MKKMKKLIVLVVIILCLGAALPKYNQSVSAESIVSASSDENDLFGIMEEITDEQFNSSVQAINDGITIENGVYKFDKNLVKDTTLTEKEIENIDALFSNFLTQGEIAEVDKVVVDDELAKDDIKKNGRAIPAVLLAAATTVAAFVALAIIVNIINDLYKLSLSGYCSKWKMYSQIKKACKQLGYLK